MICNIAAHNKKLALVAAHLKKQIINNKFSLKVGCSLF